VRIVLQRVREARVEVDGRVTGQIGKGLLALVGLAEGDTAALFPKMLEKVVALRIFPDEGGNMNRSLEETGGGLLLVSQFTLYADCRKGRRPGFSGAMAPELARALFAAFVEAARTRYSGGAVETGEFGAMMDVHLVNDGPVTIVLDSGELIQKDKV
jgi:D-tyrosyl-tRNA(Tyr) deacylase